MANLSSELIKISTFILISVVVLELCRRIAVKYKIGINKHLKKGNILFDKEDYDGALNEFKKALKNKNYKDISQYMIGLCYERKGDIKNAIIELEKAIKLDPDSSETYVELSLIYKNLDQPDKAIELMNTAIQKDQSDEHAYVELGNLYYKVGKEQMAIDMLEKGISLKTVLSLPKIPSSEKKTDKCRGKMILNFLKIILQTEEV